MIIALSVIRDRARSRPPGYMDDIMAVSTIVGQNIEISVEDLRELRLKYRVGGGNHIGGCAECSKVKDNV